MSKHLRTYHALCPEDLISDDDPRRGDIMAEMRAIRAAKTDEDAARIIEWWGWPGPHYRTALEFAREARRIMRAGARA